MAPGHLLMSSPGLMSEVAAAKVLLLCLVAGWSQTISCHLEYEVPNPFKENLVGYYKIESQQTAISSQNKLSTYMVTDFFSLDLGLSYSYHENRDDPEETFAYIGDGPRASAYVVRDASSYSSFDCEFDHQHHHKQVFPWQYTYDVGKHSDSKTSNKEVKPNTRQAKARKKFSKKREIYGVGAIWLNAIERNLKSRLVGQNSPYESSNVWMMNEGDLGVALMFDKPEVGAEPASQRSMEEQIAGSNLISIKIVRHSSLAFDMQTSSMGDAGLSTESITVKEFKKGIDASDQNSDDHQILQKFLYQLSECHSATRKHRLIPSLLRTISLAPSRAYALDYIMTTYQRHNNAELEEANLENRPSSNQKHEFRSEWFSYDLEAEAVLVEEKPNEDSDKSRDLSETSDVFLKRFTDSKRSLATINYHIIHRNTIPETCKLGERLAEPPMSLMHRKLHFHQKEEPTKTTNQPNQNIEGYMTGLGALLMNAADRHYTQFSLFKKTIDQNLEPLDPKSTSRVKVNEWSFVDQKSGYGYHFFFKATSSAYEKHEISDLVRVDIRDTRLVDPDDNVTTRLGDDDQNISDFDMLLRFNVLQVDTNLNEEALRHMLEVPSCCQSLDPNGNISEEPEYSNKDSDDDDDDDDVEIYGGDADEDEYQADSDSDFGDADLNDHDSDDEDTKKPNDLHGDQNQGEFFEFEPGNVLEEHQMPDFYKFLDGYTGYRILSNISVESPADSGLKRKHIYLRETVDLAESMAHLEIFSSKLALQNERPNKEYFINYSNELIFELGTKRTYCSIEADVEPWLRLFGAHLTYRRRADTKEASDNGQTTSNTAGSQDGKKPQKAIIMTSRLSFYGLGALWRRACDSDMTFLAGVKRGVLKRPGDEHQYKEVIWAENENLDMILDFSFLYDKTKALELKKGHKALRNADLMSLHAIYSSELFPFDTDKPTKFRRFRAEVISIEASSSYSWTLPDVCQEVTSSQSGSFMIDVKVPAFMDFIEATNQYYVEYEFRSTSRGKSDTMNQLATVQVREFYDRTKNRGKLIIGTGPNTREVFIDGKRKFMYLYEPEKNQCRRALSLKPLIDLPIEQNKNFDLNQMYGLAELWQLLSGSDTIILTKTPFFNMRGDKLEYHTYKLNRPAYGSELSHYEIKMTFTNRIIIKGSLLEGKPREHLGEEFKLSQIDLWPKLRDGKSTHHIVIDVETIENKIPKDSWNLPPECEAITINTDEQSTKQPSSNNQDQDGAKPTPRPTAKPVAKPTVQPTIKPTAKPAAKPAPSDRPEPPAPIFPDLTSLIANQFHMRAEMVMQNDFYMQDSEIYLLDEWYHFEHYRVRTSTMNKNLDLLVYGKTNQVFDLSNKFHCEKSSRPTWFRVPSGIDLNVHQTFWTDSKPKVERLADLLYAPMALWMLASRGQVKRSLASRVLFLQDTNTKAESNQLIESVSERVIWQISKPDDPKGETPNSGRSNPQWSYNMTFDHMFQVLPDGQLRQWHVLVSIVAMERLSDSSLRTVGVEISNYRYKLNEEQILDNFLIPEGHGCWHGAEGRKQLDLLVHELSLSWSNDQFELWYEATIEAWGKYGNGKKRYGSSVASGSLVSGNKELRSFRDVPMYVFLHQAQVRFANGSAISKRFIHDDITMVQSEIDAYTGFCKLEPLFEAKWVLEFDVADGGTDEILLDDHKIKQFFTDTRDQNFQPLNRYTSGHYQVNSYEMNLNFLRLSSRLGGPASIIRTYRHQRAPINNPQVLLPDYGSSFKAAGRVLWLNDISVKVLLFDYSRKEIVARLNIMLYQFEAPPFNKLLSWINVASCYNTGIESTWQRPTASYRLDYHLEPREMQWARLNTDEIEILFINSLLTNWVHILPLQMDGPPRVTFEREQLMRVNFRLLEAPTAIEYFNKRFEAKMSPQLEAIAELRPTNLIDDCSRWCDEVACVAMSYCMDRICRIVTQRMLSKRIDVIKSYKSELPPRETLDPSVLWVHETSCSYFFRSRKQITSLEKFARQMSDQINEDNSKNLQTLLWGVRIQDHKVYPMKFSELKRELDSAQEDQFQVDMASDSQVSSTFSAKDFIVYKQDTCLYGDIQALGAIVQDKTIEVDKLVKVAVTQNYADCLSSCIKFECIILSYSSSTKMCIYVANGVELKGVLTNWVQERADCTLLVRNLLDAYSQFPDTRRPTTFVRHVKDYTALECAYACSMANGESQNKLNCLSFDHCTLRRGNEDNEVIETNCYLQETHVMMSSFDRSIIVGPLYGDNNNNSTDEIRKLAPDQELSCDHYSKSVLADFHMIPRRKFAEKTNAVMRGNNAETCAIYCQQDDKCLAFEYCFNDAMQPAQACYLFLLNETQSAQPEGETKNDLTKLVESRLVNSRKCSVYTIKHFPEQYEILENSIASVIDQVIRSVPKHGFSYYMMLLLTLALAALLVAGAGSAIQVACIKLIGRPVLFD